MADVNPWSAEGWNITAQMDYVRRFGVDRAEARARDAGTRLGGPRPRAAAGTVPGFVNTPDGPVRYIVMNRIVERAVAAPPSAFFVVAEIHPNIGADMAAVLTRELILPPSAPAVGFDAAAAVTLELDLPAASASLGFATAVASLETAMQSTVHSLGTTMAVVVDLISNIVFDPFTALLGYSTAATLTREADIVAAPAIGLATAVVVQLGVNLDLAAGPSLGYSTAAVVQLERQLSMSAALGAAMATTLTHDTISLTAADILGISQAVAVSLIGSVSSFSQVGSTTTSITDTINYPAGIQAGDIAICLHYQGSSASASPVPANWWYQAALGSTSIVGSLVRVLDGTEGASITFGTSGGGWQRCMLVFRPDAPVQAMRLLSCQNNGAASSTGSTSINETTLQGVVPTLWAGLLASTSGGTVSETGTHSLTGTISSASQNYFASFDTAALQTHALAWTSAQTNGMSTEVALSFYNANPPTLSNSAAVSGTDFNRATSATSLTLTNYTPAVGDSHVVILIAYKAAAGGPTVTATGVTFTQRKQSQQTLNAATYTCEIWTAPAWSGAKTITVGSLGSVDTIIQAITIKGGTTLFSDPRDPMFGPTNLGGGTFSNAVTHGTNSTRTFVSACPDFILDARIRVTTGTGAQVSGFTEIHGISNVGNTWSLYTEYKTTTAPVFSNSYVPFLESTADASYNFTALSG